jgi:uncharacterized protein involved in exopolysaccharide biosynthesis
MTDDTAEEERGESQLRLLDIANLILSLRHRFLGAVLVSGTIGLIAALLIGRAWQSSSSFLPKGRAASVGNLAGVAAQFGIAVPAGEAAQSPAFYADLITSRELLERIADGDYVAPAGKDTARGKLADLLKVGGATPELQRDAVVRKLSGMIIATPIAKTGVVRVTVTASNPTIAYEINTRLLQQVDSFNLVRRQSQAAAERRFAGERVTAARDDLKLAEERLLSFMERNRVYRNESNLAIERDRLAREVTMRQQVYTALVQSFEQARLEEVRDTPLITIIEHPAIPVIPKSRNLVVIVLGTALALMLLALIREIMHRNMSASRDRGDPLQIAFDGLMRDARSELRIGSRKNASEER